MKKYRIGIIGFGGFGKFLYHWWDKLDNVEVVAVSDSKHRGFNPERYTIYNDWHDLLNADNIDIVSIVTPPAFHVEMACAAMNAGKDVLLEKPVAISLDGVNELIRVQKETGRTITVNHMLRYNPLVKTLGELSKNGSIGQLRHAMVSNYAQDSSLLPEHWFWDKKLSGGILVEHAVHFFDIINSLTDQNYIRVSGASHNRNEIQEDQVSATVLYDKGLIASHYHGFASPGFFEKTTIRLAFDLARIEIDGWIPLTGKIEALVNPTTLEQIKILPGLKIESLELIDEIQDDSRPEGWGDDDPVPPPTQIFSGGVAYDVSQRLKGTFDIGRSKGQVYGECVQDIMKDLIAKIEDPGHNLNITLEDAIESLKIALLASDDIKRNI